MTIEPDNSTPRQYAEGVSPLTQVREYPMSEHTPGPWFTATISPECDTQLIMAKRTNGACGVAEVYLPPYPEGGESNARLIAAAPDLLEALEEAVECGMVPKSSAKDGGASSKIRHVQVADQIRNAIAKARGENHD